MRQSISIAGLALLIMLALTGCGSESRPMESDQPQTPPTGIDDPRIPYFDGNFYQISQGGRYSIWYGCESCHGLQATGVENLADDKWQHGGQFPDIYRFIADNHPAPNGRYGERIPVEQLWQITAYIRNLTTLGPEMRRRQSFDLSREPQAPQQPAPEQ